MCDHRGPFNGDMPCTRTDEHDPTARAGHTYVSAWAPDGRHDDNTQED